MSGNRAASVRRRTVLRLGDALDRLGLAQPAFRARELLRARRERELPALGSDGLPLPPSRLQVLVTGGASEHFVAWSEPLVQSLRDLIARTGPDLEQLGSVLDFGVGCGRIARHWAAVQGPVFHGCDYNEELVAWCRENLPFLETRVTGLTPPLPYESGKFDLIYAYSVLTHMPEDLQHRWIKEFTRVLAPEGRLILSTHGESVRGSMSLEERTVFDSGRCAVRFSNSTGSNLCTAYQPRAWVERELLAGWQILETVDGGAPGMPQDLYVARRPS